MNHIGVPSHYLYLFLSPILVVTVFALVTSSGSLIAYNMNVKAKALLKITAHSGESTTLAWHPIQPNVVATGGASDRCVKVWDLESYLSMKKDDSNMASNVNTMTSVMTDTSAESNTSR
jgi:WD40 repeat protein